MAAKQSDSASVTAARPNRTPGSGKASGRRPETPDAPLVFNRAIIAYRASVSWPGVYIVILWRA